MTDQHPTRRTVLRGSAVALGIGTVAILVPTTADRAYAQASIDAENVTVDDDGTILTLTIRPNVEITWSNFVDPPTNLDIEVHDVRFDHGQTGSWTSHDPNISESFIPTTTTDHTESHLFSQPYDLISTTDADNEDFEPEGAGSFYTDVEVHLKATIANDTEETTAEAVGSFWVNVERPDPAASIGGSLGTDGSA